MKFKVRFIKSNQKLLRDLSLRIKHLAKKMIFKLILKTMQLNSFPKLKASGIATLNSMEFAIGMIIKISHMSANMKSTHFHRILVTAKTCCTSKRMIKRNRRTEKKKWKRSRDTIRNSENSTKRKEKVKSDDVSKYTPNVSYQILLYKGRLMRQTYNLHSNLLKCTVYYIRLFLPPTK